MKTALHSISYAGVWPGQAHLDITEFIKKAAELGYDGIMMTAKRPHLSVLDMNNETVKRVRGVMEDAGVALACMAGYNNFSADAGHPDIPISEMQIAYLTHLAQLTQALGGRIIRVFTAYQHEALSEWALRERVITCLKESARRAADYGCVLAVQNHHDCGAHWETLRDLLADVDEPNALAGFDAWTPTLHGDEITVAATAMAPLMAQTIVADYVRRRRFNYIPSLVNYERQPDLIQAMPVGEGIIDYEGFLNALRTAGFDGYVIYEMCSPLRGGGSLENLDRCARKFLQFVKPWTAK